MGSRSLEKRSGKGEKLTVDFYRNVRNSDKSLDWVVLEIRGKNQIPVI